MGLPAEIVGMKGHVLDGCKDGTVGIVQVGEGTFGRQRFIFDPTDLCVYQP